MAFGGGGANDGAAPIAEINITPLTDVMLVLLIIAMVIAPTLAFKGAQMNLPAVDKPQQFDEKDNLLQITSEGQLFFNQEPADEATIAAGFDELVTNAGREQVTLIIAGDPQVPYQRILDMWNLATAHKIEQIVLAGEVVDQYGNTLLTGTAEESASPPAPDAAPSDAAPSEATAADGTPG